MRPLGPLNGKSFHTTISPWIITWEALEACQIDAVSLEAPPAPYLQREKRKIPSITLQVEITKADEPNSKTVVCTTRPEYLYWTFEDMIVQQTINGCSLRPGDILATGTVSGSQDSERGCLIESTFGGKEPLTLSDSTTRGYLEDGDVERLTGTGIITGSNNVLDFGESTAQVVPARRWSK
jgi:fumarylacetoacetase